ncbi:hypothetical protein [Nocardia sp. NPDC006630]|uniref:hypothetical protein n=1 Tax=Nocardia sp. NPDC006630 TaxID=3157181 RepID=UPI0033A19965
MITHLSLEAVLAVENLNPQAPPGSNGLLLLGNYLKWLAYLVGLLGIVYGGAKFAVEKWNGGVCESPKIVAASLIGGAVVAASGALMTQIINAAGS